MIPGKHFGFAIINKEYTTKQHLNCKVRNVNYLRTKCMFVLQKKLISIFCFSFLRSGFQRYVRCPLLVSPLCFPYCFCAHLFLCLLVKYYEVLFLLLVCLPSAVCVFVLLLVCILLMHFSTLCTFYFSTFISIFLLFILLGTYSIGGWQQLGDRGCQLGCGISCMYVHATREVWVFILLGIFYSWMVVFLFVFFYWIVVYIFFFLPDCHLY